MECACGCFVWMIVFTLAALLLIGNPAAFFVIVAIMIVIKWFER